MPRILPATPWLALAAGLLLVSNGRWIVPAAAWLAPAALLVFLDRTRSRPGLGLGLLAYVLVQFVAWWGLIPAPGILYFLIAATYGVVYFLPFTAHRLLAHRMTGVQATLVFPLAWVAIEFLFHRWGTPYGSWFSLAYTQTDTLSLMQLASVTGTAGISFLMTWFAAIAAWILHTRRAAAPDWRRVKLVGGSYAAITILVLGSGHLCLALQPNDPLHRTAGLVPNPQLMLQHEQTLLPIRRGQQLSPAGMDSMVQTATRLNDDLFRRTTREAAAGATLIAWSETAGRVLRKDESVFLARAGQIASEHGAYVLLAYGVWDADAPKPFENKVAAIDASGAVEWEFLKAHPIIGAESFFTPAGDGVIRSIDTPPGRVGAVICHDLDFPPLLQQAPDLAIGLMVGPSADWRDITPLHANMAIPRAIENGFSLLRPTSGGRSIAVDYRGRTVAAIDYADDGFVAYLPFEPSFTVYGIVGDLFSWICLVGFVSLGVLGLRGVRKHR